MKKLLFVLFWFVCFSFCLTANAFAEGFRKPVILVASFTHDHSFSNQEANQLRTATLNWLRDGRIIIKDAATAQEVSEEIRRQIMNAQSAEEIMSISEVRNQNVDYILMGGFNTLVVDQKQEEYTNYKKEKVVKTYWQASLNYSYTLLSVKDGTVTYSYASSSSNRDNDSHDKARAGIFSHGCVFPFGFYDAIAPLQADLVESDYVIEKDKLKTCYVKLGSDHGVHSGTELQVFKVTYIAGQEVLEPIGYMEITDVVAPGLSKCKMRKRNSGKDILKAIKENLKVQLTNPDARPLQVKVIGSIPGFFS
ncbi:MAG: hypothetical protein J6W47_01545 [Bacteroidales bacterium]|nr:hypothetical protein [Bacteroidales bacterium]MBP5763774.1 hypothetical protein [Bacteroidales bacterium]